MGAKYRGRYFFADFIQGRVWSIGLRIDQDGEGHALNVIEHTSEIGDGTPLGNISSFGVDALGELYVVAYPHGDILKLLTSADLGISAPTGTQR